MKKNTIKLNDILSLLLVISLIFVDIINIKFFNGKNHMIAVYSFVIAFLIVLIITFIQSIKQKKYLKLITYIFMLFFIIFLTSSLKLGGTIAEDAASKYELYEEGCYYLVSHNNYTKVTYEQYQYMKIIEIVGRISFFISFGLSLFNNYKVKKEKTNNEGAENFSNSKN